MTRLIGFIGVSNFQGNRYPAGSDLNSLLSRHECVLSEYHIDSASGNQWYKFEILGRNDEKTIEVNGWKIIEIRTASGFNPKTIDFNIIDPTGLSDRDAEIVRCLPNGGGIQHFLGFNGEGAGVGLTSLNEGLAFFKRLTNFRNWTHFLRDTNGIEYLTKTMEENQSLKRENRRLVEEVRTLRAKLQKIRELVE